MKHCKLWLATLLTLLSACEKNEPPPPSHQLPPHNTAPLNQTQTSEAERAPYRGRRRADLDKHCPELRHYAHFDEKGDLGWKSSELGCERMVAPRNFNSDDFEELARLRTPGAPKEFGRLSLIPMGDPTRMREYERKKEAYDAWEARVNESAIELAAGENPPTLSASEKAHLSDRLTEQPPGFFCCATD